MLMENNILKKLDTLLGNQGNDLYGVYAKNDDEIFNRMFEFITSLEPDQLSEEQAGIIMDIIDDTEMEFDGVNEIELEYDGVNEDDDSLEEAPKRVKRDRGAARKRAKSYRRNKNQRKRAAKKYRKSAKGKQMLKKSKRMKKRGKTASGKRIRQYR